MARSKSSLFRFVASTRGVAAIEFAFVAPIMLLLLLAFFDAAKAIAIYTKVRVSSSTLGEITNQYTTIHDTDMTSIFGATAVVLSPYSSAPASAVVSEIYVTTTTKATVSWSSTLNGVALTVGSTVTIPSGLAAVGSYLILNKVSYTYTPSFGYLFTGPIVLSDTLYVTPRNSASITRTSP